MGRKILVSLGVVLLSWFSFFGVNAPVVMAEDCSDPGFLGFHSWYHNLPMDQHCSPTVQKDKSGDKIAEFVWTIVLNVIFDIFVALGYLSTGFIIYGGYLYIMSSGDPVKTAKAKKTLVSAVSGAVIALLATVIVNTIITILGV